MVSSESGNSPYIPDFIFYISTNYYLMKNIVKFNKNSQKSQAYNEQKLNDPHEACRSCGIPQPLFAKCPHLIPTLTS